MGRRPRDPSALSEIGVISFRLSRAALCCEESCEVIFDMVPGRSTEAVVCPGCGGASWLPLSSIVLSLRVPSPYLRAATRLSA